MLLTEHKHCAVKQASHWKDQKIAGGKAIFVAPKMTVSVAKYLTRKTVSEKDAIRGQ